jgi:hypothetical protein
VHEILEISFETESGRSEKILGVIFKEYSMNFQKILKENPMPKIFKEYSMHKEGSIRTP